MVAVIAFMGLLSKAWNMVKTHIFIIILTKIPIDMALIPISFHGFLRLLLSLRVVFGLEELQRSFFPIDKMFFAISSQLGIKRMDKLHIAEVW